VLASAIVGHLTTQQGNPDDASAINLLDAWLTPPQPTPPQLMPLWQASAAHNQLCGWVRGLLAAPGTVARGMGFLRFIDPARLIRLPTGISVGLVNTALASSIWGDSLAVPHALPPAVTPTGQPSHAMLQAVWGLIKQGPGSATMDDADRLLRWFHSERGTDGLLHHLRVPLWRGGAVVWVEAPPSNATIFHAAAHTVPQGDHTTLAAALGAAFGEAVAFCHQHLASLAGWALSPLELTRDNIVAWLAGDGLPQFAHCADLAPLRNLLMPQPGEAIGEAHRRAGRRVLLGDTSLADAQTPVLPVNEADPGLQQLAQAIHSVLADDLDGSVARKVLTEFGFEPIGPAPVARFLCTLQYDADAIRALTVPTTDATTAALLDALAVHDTSDDGRYVQNMGVHMLCGQESGFGYLDRNAWIVPSRSPPIPANQIPANQLPAMLDGHPLVRGALTEATRKRQEALSAGPVDRVALLNWYLADAVSPTPQMDPVVRAQGLMGVWALLSNEQRNERRDAVRATPWLPLDNQTPVAPASLPYDFGEHHAALLSAFPERIRPRPIEAIRQLAATQGWVQSFAQHPTQTVDALVAHGWANAGLGPLAAIGHQALHDVFLAQSGDNNFPFAVYPPLRLLAHFADPTPPALLSARPGLCTALGNQSIQPDLLRAAFEHAARNLPAGNPPLLLHQAAFTALWPVYMDDANASPEDRNAFVQSLGRLDSARERILQHAPFDAADLTSNDRFRCFPAHELARQGFDVLDENAWLIPPKVRGDPGTSTAVWWTESVDGGRVYVHADASAVAERQRQASNPRTDYAPLFQHVQTNIEEPVTRALGIFFCLREDGTLQPPADPWVLVIANKNAQTPTLVPHAILYDFNVLHQLIADAFPDLQRPIHSDVLQVLRSWPPTDNRLSLAQGQAAWTYVLNTLARDGWGLDGTGLTNCNTDPIWSAIQDTMQNRAFGQCQVVGLLCELQRWHGNPASSQEIQTASLSALRTLDTLLIAQDIPDSDARLLFMGLVTRVLTHTEGFEPLLDRLGSESGLRTSFLALPPDLQYLTWLSQLIQNQNSTPPAGRADFVAGLMVDMLRAFHPNCADLGNILLPTRQGNGQPWKFGCELTVTDRSDVAPERIVSDACRDALDALRLEARVFEDDGGTAQQDMSVCQYLEATGRFHDAALRPLLGVLAWSFRDVDTATLLIGRNAEQLQIMAASPEDPNISSILESLRNAVIRLTGMDSQAFRLRDLTPKLTFQDLAQAFSAIIPNPIDEINQLIGNINQPNLHRYARADHARRLILLLRVLINRAELELRAHVQGNSSPCQVRIDNATSLYSLTRQPLELAQDVLATNLCVRAPRASDTSPRFAVMKAPSYLNSASANIERIIEHTINSIATGLGSPRQAAAARRLFQSVANGPQESIADYRNEVKNEHEWMGSPIREIERHLLEAKEARRKPAWREVFRIAEDPENANLLADEARVRIGQRGYRISSPLFELLQNADDAVTELLDLGHTNVCRQVLVELEPQSATSTPVNLHVIHFGRPIGDVHLATDGNIVSSERQRRWRWDLPAMVRWGQSTKRVLHGDGDGATTIETGYYGLGFKSVFLVTREPIIASGVIPPFRIIGGRIPSLLDDHEELRDELQQRLEALRAAHSSPVTPTLFRLPLRDGVFDEMWQSFHRYYRYSLLFCRSVRSICIDGAEASWTQTAQQSGGIQGLVHIFRNNEPHVLVLSHRFAKLLFFLDRSENIASVPDDPAHPIPRVWVLAPTRADAARVPFLVNAGFELNEGRGDLRADGNHTNALHELSRAVEEFIDRLRATAETRRTSFLLSLWRAFFSCELPASGSTAGPIRELLWGNGGLLRLVAAEFGAPDRDPVRFPDQCQLRQISDGQDCLLARDVLAHAMAHPEWREEGTVDVRIAHPADNSRIFIDVTSPVQATSGRALTMQQMLSELLKTQGTVQHISQQSLSETAADDSPNSTARAQAAKRVLALVFTIVPETALGEAIGSRTYRTLTRILGPRIIEKVQQRVGVSSPSPPSPPASEPAPTPNQVSLSNHAALDVLQALSNSVAAERGAWHSDWHPTYSPEVMRNLLLEDPESSRTPWMRLFTLSSSQVLGRPRAQHHLGFVDHLQQRGSGSPNGSWWDRLFNDGPPQAERWFEVLREWSDGRPGGPSQYDHWMTLLPELFVVSRHLAQYVQLLRNAGSHPNQTPENLLRPLIDPEYRGTNFTAPALPRLRANWIVRELVRIRFFSEQDVSDLWPLCFQNSGRLRRVLLSLGCNLGNENTHENLTSPQLWNAWIARCDVIGFGDITFDDTFDLALLSGTMEGLLP